MPFHCIDVDHDTQQVVRGSRCDGGICSSPDGFYAAISEQTDMTSVVVRIFGKRWIDESQFFGALVGFKW